MTYQPIPQSFQPAESGLLLASCDPALCSSQNSGTSKYIILVKLWVPAQVTIANLIVLIGTAGATLTSAQNLGGIYDSNGNLIAQTADQSANWTSTGRKVMALTAQGAYTLTLAGGPSVFYWAALLAVGTTLPKFVCPPIWSNSAITSYQPGVGAPGYASAVGSGANQRSAYESSAGGTRTSLVSLAGLQITEWTALPFVGVS